MQISVKDGKLVIFFITPPFLLSIFYFDMLKAMVRILGLTPDVGGITKPNECFVALIIESENPNYWLAI